MDSFFIITDYVKGKEIYPPIRRILNILFSISITSYCFETFYFKYDWLDLNYKLILSFFIKGDFFVPFSLFLVVHFGVYFLSMVLFNLTMNIKSIKATTKILAYQLEKKEIKLITKKFANNPIAPIKITEDFLLNLYNHIKNTVTEEKWMELEQYLAKQKQIIEHNFNLIFKLIAVVTIYFITIHHFGLLLYVFILTLSLLSLIILWWLHLGLETLPAMVQKFDSEIQKYYQNTISSIN